jgi:hypothetical protein
LDPEPDTGYNSKMVWNASCVDRENMDDKSHKFYLTKRELNEN